MTKTLIRFKAKLFRPAESEKGGSWIFLVLPKNVSEKLPSRGMTAIEGTINGSPFQAALEPDGEKSHWLKVDRKLGKSAGADAGDIVTLEIAPAAEDPEPHGAREFSRGARGRRPEGAGVVVGYHAQRAPGLDPLDHLRQARRDAHAPDQKCLLDARRWEAPRLLL